MYEETLSGVNCTMTSFAREIASFVSSQLVIERVTLNHEARILSSIKRAICSRVPHQHLTLIHQSLRHVHQQYH
jgi:hypothetical protein